MLVFAGVLALALPVGATKPCPQEVEPRRTPCMPSPKERGQIMHLLSDVRKAETELFDALAREERLRADAVKKGGRFLTEWSERYEAVKERSAEINQKSKEVVRLTQLYYGVGPNQHDGRVANGPFAKSRAHWQPVLQKAEDFVYRAERADGSPFFMKYPDNGSSYATTLEDGTTFISQRVLSRALEYGSPAIIAAALHHEGAHFDGLVGKGWKSRESAEYNALARELAIDEDIGLEDVEVEWSKRKRKEIGPLGAALRQTNPFINADLSDSNSVEWGDAQARLRAIRKEREALEQRLQARRQGRHEGTLRDSLNERRPDGTASNGCGSAGMWVGEVFFPPMPCPEVIYTPPSQAPPAAAAPPAVVVPAQPPAAAAPGIRLTELAARFCADPSAATWPSSHEAFRTAWFDRNDAGESWPACQRDVYAALKLTRQEGYEDYNSEYFQALAERSRNPPASPSTDIEIPAPRPRPNVPDCIMTPGGRCARRV